MKKVGKQVSGFYIDWHPDKAEANFRKHGIDFEEAATVFDDTDARFMYDDEHSTDEERFNILGKSLFSRLLIVCHCYRDDDSVIRIISARKATKKERGTYGGGA